MSLSSQGSLRDRYYQRIRPVVGGLLHGKRVGVTCPELLATAVDALARSGVLSWRVCPGPLVAVGSPLAVALGERWIGWRAGEALLAHLREHNQWEDRWDLRVVDEPLADSPDLLLTSRPALLAAAAAAQVPAAAALVLEGGAATGLLLGHPTLPPPPAELLELLAAAACLAPGAPARRLDLLDAGDLAAAVGRLLLLQGSGREAPDLQARTLGVGATLILRGSPRWPWEVTFVPPSARESLARMLGQPWPRPDDEAVRQGLWRRQRLLVIGCGTASNWLPELGARFGTLGLMDGKAFSVENPVRQLVRTALVEGQLKPFALIEELSRRAGPERADDWRSRLVACPLHATLEDPASVDAYTRLLDELRPDLVLVGVGRSPLGDDYLLTRELRRRGIPHLVATAFPGVTHYKHLVIDGRGGLAYDQLQGRLAVDRGPAPALDEEARQLFYGGTQPATLVETLPSVHSGLRLLEQLALPAALRRPWFSRLLGSERPCLVGANRVASTASGPLYGVEHPFQLVAYGPTGELLAAADAAATPSLPPGRHPGGVGE
ncbi:MAG: hypothetical protein RBU45_26665 [Myxococcota bacterium]|nr:hypothetical protein [Myxococcota bacterium]